LAVVGEEVGQDSRRDRRHRSVFRGIGGTRRCGDGVTSVGSAGLGRGRRYVYLESHAAMVAS